MHSGLNQPPPRGALALRAVGLAVSLALNVGLLAWLLRPAPGTANAARSAPAANPDTAGSGAGPALQPPSPHPPADAAVPWPFHWGEIESDDYRQYIANLRAVGCPEETIRDLVAADLAALYLPRARAILAPKPREYWQKHDQPNPDAAQRRELLALEQEQSRVFRDLLGGRSTFQDRIDTLFLQLHGNEQQLLFLSEDKRAAALDLLAESGLESRELEMQTRGRYTGDEEQRLFDEKLALLARVLDPTEVEEFRLRFSRDSQSLRSELQYFPCTPEEFQTLLDARTRGGDKAKVATGDLINRGPATEQVRGLLGEERAREFERVTDIHYQQARRELETQHRWAAWELTSARMSGQLDREGAAQLAAMEREQREALARLLSPQEFAEYLVRESPAARYVLTRVPAASSEAEFRAIVRLADELGLDPNIGNDAASRFGQQPLDDALAKADSERLAEFQGRLKELLGEERVAEQAAEQQATAERERELERERQQERERARLTALAESVGVSADEAGQFLDRLKAQQAELQVRFTELEQALTGTPEERKRQMEAVVMAELEQQAVEVMGEKGRDFVKRLGGGSREP